MPNSPPSKLDSQAASNENEPAMDEKSTTSLPEGRRRLPKRLWLIASVYALCLVGLLYIAWVNIQSGNQ